MCNLNRCVTLESINLPMPCPKDNNNIECSGLSNGVSVPLYLVRAPKISTISEKMARCFFKFVPTEVNRNMLRQSIHYIIRKNLLQKMIFQKTLNVM